VAANGSNGKREAVALAVASGLSLRKAAEQCRVGERTVMRWHAEDESFRRRIAELRTQLFDEAVGLLSRLGGKAALVLGLLLDSDSEKVRLAAAKAVLDQATKTRDLAELAAGVEELKQRLDDQDRARKQRR
jgi:transposase